MKPDGLNPEKVDAFAGKLVDLLNSGAVSLMISIGHRTGLFDTLAQLPPSTSSEIAVAANLNERYVREWLGAMAVARIVEYDAESLAYSLPAEHAACLTREAGPDNLATFAQYTAVLGSVEDDIAQCFRQGGGVAYEKYERFHDVMAEESGQVIVPALVDSILPLADNVVERLQAGIDVLDIGCGRGRALTLLAGTFPNSRFVGYDLSTEAIEYGRSQAALEGLENLRFEQKDLTYFSEPKGYDLITAFDAIHDQARPDLVLSGIAGALREDGVFLMQDIAGSSHVHKNLDHPLAPMLYTISCMHCMSVSLAQGGAGLGAMWGQETALRMLKEAGFGRTEVKRLVSDIQNYYYINRVA
jgi:2-polyprenyl-3-methyl-5-hydroxy-6-metoxy-1,4-benzoquinol methylase